MSVYRDAQRDEHRRRLSRSGFPSDMFSVGEVNDNSSRQRLMYPDEGPSSPQRREMVATAAAATAMAASTAETARSTLSSDSTILGVSRSILKAPQDPFEDDMGGFLSAPNMLPAPPYSFHFDQAHESMAQEHIGTATSMDPAYDLLSNRDDMFAGGYIPMDEFNSSRMSDRLGYTSDSYTYQSDPRTDHSECWTPTTMMVDVTSDVPPDHDGIDMLEMDAEVDADTDADAEGEEDDENESAIVSPTTPAGSAKKGYYCDVSGCNRQQPFGSRSDLRRHKATVHKENLRGQATFLCADPACRGSGKQQKLWRRKDNFKTHCKVKHPESDLDDLMRRSQELASGHKIDAPTTARSKEESRCYQCKNYEHVGRLFKREADLNRHLRTVHSLKEQRFDCLVSPSCPRRGSKGFQRKDHWRNHLRKAHGIQRLECGYGDGCTSAFDLADIPQEYQKHVKVYHGEDKPTRELRVPGTNTGLGFRGYRHFHPAA